MFNSAFAGVGANAVDYYPEALREEIDAINERIYRTVNKRCLSRRIRDRPGRL